MSQMPDGNTAALRLHEAEQDRLDRRHVAYGESVMEDVIERLFSVEKVKGYTLHDFARDALTEDELVALFRNQPRDDAIAAYDKAKACIADYMRRFFEQHEAEYLADIERDREEDARAEARSER